MDFFVPFVSFLFFRKIYIYTSSFNIIIDEMNQSFFSSNLISTKGNTVHHEVLFDDVAVVFIVCLHSNNASE